MPVYAKLIAPSAPAFANRVTSIYAVAKDRAVEVSHIPVPNFVVLCNGCNKNIASTPDTPLYMVYLDKQKLAADRPYDCYCEPCLKRYFPKVVKVVS